MSALKVQVVTARHLSRLKGVGGTSQETEQAHLMDRVDLF
jgi:hypothetical protein